MSHSIEESRADDSINLVVYLALLGLTAATLGAGLLSGKGRVMAVSLAVIIASVKASLIGFYYMGLRRERALTWIIIAIGALAVAVLAIGILPDMTFRRL